MIAALLLALNLLERWRDTNSHASNARGVKAFEQKKYAEAAKAFAKQGQSSVANFNRGTAQVAAGDREQGSQTLAKALEDPSLRADSFYNRGKSALDAKAYDYAIHDFSEALKVNPRDGAAKRNLEIALAKKQAEQKQKGSNNRDKNGASPKPQPQPSGGDDTRKGDPNGDALLRSVQQQEQEELARMHRARPERVRVGW